MNADRPSLEQVWQYPTDSPICDYCKNPKLLQKLKRMLVDEAEAKKGGHEPLSASVFAAQ